MNLLHNKLNQDEQYMNRAIELASNGLGYVQPNPMVGCVIVKDNCIIGEGWHRIYGQAHAEINAINSVFDKSLLKESTLYVNLEPCSHYGKTPPCAKALIEYEIPKVVIANQDSNPKVSGQGIQMLQQAGIQVKLGVLESEAHFLNRRFFTFYEKKRPYIILKWATTLDGFMDIDRTQESHSYWITNKILKTLSHQWRSEESAILVGYRTIVNDNPQLTVRLVDGKNPVRLVYDKYGNIDKTYHVFNQDAATYCFSTIEELLKLSETYHLQSIIVEGGCQTLNLFIQNNLWDEARILIGNSYFGSGLKAPQLGLKPNHIEIYEDNRIAYIYH